VGDDDLLPAARAVGAASAKAPRRSGSFGRRRRHDAPDVDVPAAGEPVFDGAAAPTAAPTPDDREAYAFWTQDRAPRDFSDVMSLPDQPLDGSDG
jgi:hypothetical protein